MIVSSFLFDKWRRFGFNFSKTWESIFYFKICFAKNQTVKLIY